MTDELDFVQYLRQWASVNPNDQTIRDLHRAADEIEHLRKELQHSALQTNVMRNIAITPYGGDGEQIADLAAELAEFQRQYLMLKKDRDRWRKICDYWYKASCSHNWRQDQAARRKYEQAVRGD